METWKVLPTSMLVAFGLLAGSEAKAVTICPTGYVLSGNTCVGVGPSLPATVFQANGSEVPGPGTYTITDGDGDFGSAVVNADGSGSATIVSATNQNFASVDYITQYYFAVEGSANESVPLQFSSTFSTGGNADAISDIAGVGGNVVGLNQYACTLTPEGVGGTCGSYPQNFTGTINFSVESNTVYEIETEAQAGALNGSAFASVDSVIIIDPSFADAGLFTIVYGPGFSPASPAGSPVPEPGSLFLFASGLATLAFFRRA